MTPVHMSRARLTEVDEQLMLLSDGGEHIERPRYLSAPAARQPAPRHDHTETGFSYRMSNVFAALGMTIILDSTMEAS